MCQAIIAECNTVIGELNSSKEQISNLLNNYIYDYMLDINKVDENFSEEIICGKPIGTEELGKLKSYLEKMKNSLNLVLSECDELIAVYEAKRANAQARMAYLIEEERRKALYLQSIHLYEK